MKSIILLVLTAICLGGTAYTQIQVKKKYFSRIAQDSILVTVWLPQDYSPAKKYPVFYEFVYDHSNYIAATIQNYFDAPKSIVVHVDLDEGNEHYSHPGLTEKGQKHYQFLVNELIPAIDKKYNTGLYRVAVGLSQGADYVNYILRNNPELFKAWLIFSIETPSYEVDFSTYISKIKQPTAYFVATADDVPERVEFARQLDSNLRKNSFLKVEKQHYPNSSHALSILYGFPDALQFIFNEYINLRPRNTGESIDLYAQNLKTETVLKYGIAPEPNNYIATIVRELKKTKDQNEIDNTLKQILPGSTDLQAFNIAYALINTAPQKSEELLWKVIAATPKQKKDQKLSPVMPYRTLAMNIYDKQGDYEKAFRTLKEGHGKIKAYDMGLLYYIGSYSLKRDFHVQEGVDALKTILKKREASSMSFFFPEDMVNAQIADGYARLKNKVLARQYANKALQVNPDNEEAKKILSSLE